MKNTYAHTNSKIDLERLIKLCKKNDRQAQKSLYEAYSGLFFSVAKRYLKVDEEAEDAMIECFYKIFSKINTYKGQGSFEGWMRRILVNECLSKLRKRRNFSLSLESANDLSSGDIIIPNLAYKDLLSILEYLPTGYRTIFNLHVVEGFKHKEIAEKLGISINTSKSQLILAKKRFRELLKKKQLSEKIS